MSQALSAAGPDRLPWLADEPTPPPARGSFPYALAFAIAAALLVAAAAYWFGTHSIEKGAPRFQRSQPSTTVPLPEPRVAEPAIEQPQQPQVKLPAPPEVQPAPEREVPISRPKPVKRIVRRAAAAPPKPEQPTAADQKPDTATKAAPGASKPLPIWPAWQSQGAAGRIVRIGAFGTRYQAKLGWRYMVRAYPAVAHLPATVVETHNSQGRAFYRFQIGTTSQAHSEVLCQRMQRIQFSCAVVGLPWKPKGVER